jgi:RNA polymerase sigma factor (sigma-70 family)
MAKTMYDSALGQVRTLFSLGRVGDRADGEILECFIAHHTEAEAAFEELVARHGAMVLEVCRRVLRNSGDVEDAFQATFLVLLRRAGSIRNRDAVGGWLHRVALRVALRARNEAAHRREAEQTAIAPDVSAETTNEAEWAEVRTALHEELDRIPASYRAAIVACYLEGLTHEEAANRLRLPVGTVRSRLSRGRDRLRDRLTRRGLAPGVALPALAGLPAPVPGGLGKLAVRSMLSYAGGHAAAGRLPGPAALAERVLRAMQVRALGVVAGVVLTVGAVAGTLPLVAMRRAVASQDKVAETRAPVAKSEPAKKLAGIVRDSEGRPVAGALVVTGKFSERPNHLIAITGPDGRFQFTEQGDSTNLGYALAYKEGLAPAGKWRTGFPFKQSNEDVELVLSRPELFVGIVQARDGRPVVGAKVRIRYMLGKGGKTDQHTVLENVVGGTPLESLFVAVTDRKGEFRFPAVPAPQRVQLAVSAEGRADLSTEVPGDREAGFISGTAAVPARLTMDPEAQVIGRVVTKMPGVSVAGVKLGLQSTHDSTMFWKDTHSDAQGRFEMRGLPEGGGNLFPCEHPNDGAWTYRAIDNLALHPGKTNEVEIELIEGVLVEVKVVEAGTGKPIARGFVGMYGPARPQSGAAIMSATTDDDGRYRFRLPPGATRLYTGRTDAGQSGSQSVIIPADVKSFTVPEIEVQPAGPRRPAAPRAALPARKKETNALEVAGFVCDVSDGPVAGALIVGAFVRGGEVSARAIARTDSRGRATLRLAGPKGPNAEACFCAFKEGLAPAATNIRLTGASRAPDLKLILARMRPFVGIVQDRQHRPIAAAEVRVQSIKVPVTEGAGMVVTEVPWPLIHGTPLEETFRTTTDEQGVFRFPSAPARSALNLVVTAKGMAAHRTTDFSRRGITGIRPLSLDDGFLHGTVDQPAKIYLAPEVPRGGGNENQ